MIDEVACMGDPEEKKDHLFHWQLTVLLDKVKCEATPFDLAIKEVGSGKEDWGELGNKLKKNSWIIRLKGR